MPAAALAKVGRGDGTFVKQKEAAAAAAGRQSQLPALMSFIHYQTVSQRFNSLATFTYWKDVISFNLTSEAYR